MSVFVVYVERVRTRGKGSQRQERRWLFPYSSIEQHILLTRIFTHIDAHECVSVGMREGGKAGKAMHWHALSLLGRIYVLP